MRILHVITGLNRGGAETMLLKLVERTESAQIRHVVVSMSGSGDLAQRFAEMRVPVIALDLKSNPFRLCALPRHIRHHRPDIVHSWMYHANLLATMTLGRGSSRPKLVWGVRHTPLELRSYKLSTRWAIRMGSSFSRSADAILYNAFVSKERHHALGYSPHNDRVIPNGFNTSMYAPSPEHRDALRRELGVDENALLIGVAARDHPIKGIDVLLDAMQQSVLKDLNLHLVMAGRGLSNDNPKVAGLVDRNHVHPVIHLLGERENMHAFFPGLDLLASPSRSEAFSNTIGEAMACGVPCVVTDVGDSARIVANTGVVVSPEDPLALAEAIAHIAALEPGARRGMGLRARDRICSEFDLDRISLQYMSLYERVIDR